MMKSPSAREAFSWPGRKRVRLFMRRATVLVGSIGAGVGCGSLTAPTEGNRLSAARVQWAATAQPGYRYEAMTLCECLQAGRWIQVTVSDGQVTAGRYLDTGTPVETAALPALPTVPMMFDRIQHALSQRAVLLEVEYDPRDGHPTLINVDVSRTIVDEEFTLRSRNLVMDPVATAERQR